MTAADSPNESNEDDIRACLGFFLYLFAGISIRVDSSWQMVTFQIDTVDRQVNISSLVLGSIIFIKATLFSRPGSFFFRLFVSG